MSIFRTPDVSLASKVNKGMLLGSLVRRSEVITVSKVAGKSSHIRSSKRSHYVKRICVENLVVFTLNNVHIVIEGFDLSLKQRNSFLLVTLVCNLLLFMLFTNYS